MNEILQRTALGPEIVVEEGLGYEQRASGARLLDPFIFYAVLAVVVLTAIPYGTVERWWVAAFECSVFVLAILALFEGLISKELQIRGLSLMAPLLALTLLLLFQSLPIFSASEKVGLLDQRITLSADPYGTRLVAVQLLALIVAGALLIRYTSSQWRLRALIYVVISIGLVTALFGLLRKSDQQGPGFLLPYLSKDQGFAQFINKNHFGFLMEMTLGLTLGLFAGEAGRRRRILILLPVTALFCVALISSNSRGGILALLCEIIFLGVFIDPVQHLSSRPVRATLPRWRNLASGWVLRTLLVVTLIVVFAFGVGWVGGEPVVNNFELTAAEFGQTRIGDSARTTRGEIWSMTWQLIKAHPLLGVGFGGYWTGITRYHHASGEITPQEAHNDYLELLASGGLIGVAPVIWFAVVFLGKTRRRLRSRDPYSRAACLGALTGIFGVACHSFVDFGLHVTINALVFTILIVIATMEIRTGKESGISERA